MACLDKNCDTCCYNDDCPDIAAERENTALRKLEQNVNPAHKRRREERGNHNKVIFDKLFNDKGE